MINFTNIFFSHLRPVDETLLLPYAFCTVFVYLLARFIAREEFPKNDLSYNLIYYNNDLSLIYRTIILWLIFLFVPGDMMAVGLLFVIFGVWLGYRKAFEYFIFSCIFSLIVKSALQSLQGL